MVGAVLAATLLTTGVTLAQTQPGTARVTRPNPPAANPSGNANTGRPAAGSAAGAPKGNAAAAPKGNVAAAPQPAAPAAPDPRMEIILKNWETSSAKIKSLHGKHIRSRSNSVFGTDARATGKFYFEAPDKGRIDLTGKPPAKGDASSLTTKEGKPYTWIADRDEKWVCDGKQILVINDAEKQYESIPLPEEMRGKNIIESPLPFLFGMKAADAKKRFQMELIGYDPKTRVAQITAIPLQNRDAQNFIRAEIHLDTMTYLPKYVALTDPAGTIVTRYIFQDVKVDDANIITQLGEIFGRGDPFAPSLRGYQKVQPPPVQQVKDTVPANGTGNRVNPAINKVPGGATPPGTNRPGTTGTLPRTTLQTPGAGTSGTRPAPR